MPDLTTEYSPEKGWLTRQFENAKRDVAEWPEWMRKESGRMKTDMTTAELDRRRAQPLPRAARGDTAAESGGR